MYATEERSTLTEFLHDPQSHLARLKDTGNPEILTVDGKAEAVLIDADRYQEIMDRLYEAETVAAIQEGLAAVERGEFKPADQVFSELKARFGIQG